MEKQLRIWRVVPISKTGVQAPYYFVETLTFTLEKGKLEAETLARKKCSVKEWYLEISKLSVRKDKFGRYWKYHQ